MADSLSDLSAFISSGLQDKSEGARDLLNSVLTGRYKQRKPSKTSVRDALGLATEDDQGIPFAGLVNPENPESGAYQGTSMVWFPTKEGSLISFVVGTGGIALDEGILTRPGHRRRVAALRSMLVARGVQAWSKPDPANVSASLPTVTLREFQQFERALKKYGSWLYCIASVPRDNPELALSVVQAFFDLYSYERGWDILAAVKDERDELINELRQAAFPVPTSALVHERLRARHFVILQGPPGTGKTRLAEQVKNVYFAGSGMTVQFHPAVSYEDFIIGLSPDINKEESLRFEVRPGWLLQACRSAAERPFLLTIDEINRADLGKILGEAIYLFEPDEVGKRKVNLAHSVNGQTGVSMPANLFVLGTMNTADRSIASIDLAIRRRFTFIPMMPDRSVVASQEASVAGLAIRIYDQICDVFIEHAPNDALDLMPGHSYYLATDIDSLKKRLRYELLPLLDEYLREGYLGSASSELSATRDTLEDAVR